MSDYFYKKSKYYYEMYKQNKLVRKVCAVVMNCNKILTLIKKDKAYLIGGSVEKNETTKNAVVREVLEETGINVKIIKYLTKTYYSVKWQFEDKNFDNKRVEFYYLCEPLDKAKATNVKGIAGEFDGDEKLIWCDINDLKKYKLNEKELRIIENLIN